MLKKTCETRKHYFCPYSSLHGISIPKAVPGLAKVSRSVRHLRVSDNAKELSVAKRKLGDGTSTATSAATLKGVGSAGSQLLSR